MAQVAIVILNYNTRDLLRDAIRSAYYDSAQHAIAVYVVDNASPDGSAAMVEAEFPQVRLIRSATNGGFAYGNNLALRQILASTDTQHDDRFIMLLNPDAALQPGALDTLIGYLQTH